MADPLLTKILDAARSPGGRHSPLYQWMWRHHAALARQFKEYPPSWSALAETFATEGLFDRDGNPPTRKTAMQTWQRVKAAKTRQASEHHQEKGPGSSETKPAKLQALKVQPVSDGSVPGVRFLDPIATSKSEQPEKTKERGNPIKDALGQAAQKWMR